MATRGEARTPRGRYSTDIETRERDAQAARLRARGLSYQEIADQLGAKSKSTAYEMVHRALEMAGKAVREEALAAELVKLDMREGAALEVLARRHVVVSNGRVVRLDDEPLQDDSVVLAALETLGRITDQRAKLLGLYAPTRTHHVVSDAVTAEIEALAAELGAHDPDHAEA